MLTWGHVIINGVLAAAVAMLFIAYQFIVAFLIGIAVPDKYEPITLLDPYVVLGGVGTAAFLYALVADNTPQRVWKGLVMVLIMLSTLPYAPYMAQIIAQIVWDFASWLFNPPLFAAAISAMFSTMGFVAVMIQSTIPAGALAAGLLIAMAPYILTTMLYYYNLFVYRPLKDALMKLLRVFAVKAHLGFLMPVGLYVVSILLFLSYLPVFFIAMFYVLGIVVGAVIGVIWGGPAAVVFDVVGLLVGILLATAIGSFFQRLLRDVPAELFFPLVPVVGLIPFILAAIPVLAVIVYSISLVPFIALIVSIAVVASPSVRGDLDKYVPVFIALFAIQTLFFFIGLAAAAEKQAGPEGVAASMVYCAGAFVDKPLATLFTPLPVIKQFINCTAQAVFQYNVTTQCFPCGAGGLATPCGPKFHQAPPWWWVDMRLWFNNTAPLWLALAEPFNVTHPFDVACIPKSRIR